MTVWLLILVDALLREAKIAGALTAKLRCVIEVTANYFVEGLDMVILAVRLVRRSIEHFKRLLLVSLWLLSRYCWQQ